MKTYINLLNRYKKAEEFFEKASYPEQVKHYDVFIDLLTQIREKENELKLKGVSDVKIHEVREQAFR